MEFWKPCAIELPKGARTRAVLTLDTLGASFHIQKLTDLLCPLYSHFPRGTLSCVSAPIREAGDLLGSFSGETHSQEFVSKYFPGDVQPPFSLFFPEVLLLEC